MSVATSFSTKGLRNGFGFCPSKVDISGYSSWVTLDGYSGSGTPDLDASLDAAMKLFWNGESVSATASSSLSFTTDDPAGGDDVSISASVTSVNFGSPVSANTFKEPKDRTCLDRIGGFIQDTDSDGGFTVTATNDNDISIIRMYNGVTTNEANFVGYGVLSSTGRGIESDTGNAKVRLISYTNETSGTTTGGSDPDDSKTVQSVGSTTISGLSFICVARAVGSVGGTFGDPTIPPGETTISSNPTASASSRTASVTETDTTVEEVTNPSPPPATVTYTTTIVTTDSAAISSIVFWTYS
jgi:hypothetical protein